MRRILRDRCGATAIEYGILAAIIGTAIVGATANTSLSLAGAGLSGKLGYAANVIFDRHNA